MSYSFHLFLIFFINSTIKKKKKMSLMRYNNTIYGASVGWEIWSYANQQIGIIYKLYLGVVVMIGLVGILRQLCDLVKWLSLSLSLSFLLVTVAPIGFDFGIFGWFNYNYVLNWKYYSSICYYCFEFLDFFSFSDVWHEHSKQWKWW